MHVENLEKLKMKTKFRNVGENLEKSGDIFETLFLSGKGQGTILKHCFYQGKVRGQF